LLSGSSRPHRPWPPWRGTGYGGGQLNAAGAMLR
jgi:hypothetical protein